MRKGLTHGLPLFLYAAAIFAVSSLPKPPPLPSVEGADKALHFVAYAGLAFLFARAYRAYWPGLSGWGLGNLSLLSAALYGLLDEIHQAFVPGRSADPADWLADSLGAAAGTLAYLLATRRRRAGSARGRLDRSREPV